MNVFDSYEKIYDEVFKEKDEELNKVDEKEDELFKVDETEPEQKDLEQITHGSYKLTEQDYDEIAKRISEKITNKAGEQDGL